MRERRASTSVCVAARRQPPSADVLLTREKPRDVAPHRGSVTRKVVQHSGQPTASVPSRTTSLDAFSHFPEMQRSPNETHTPQPGQSDRSRRGLLVPVETPGRVANGSSVVLGDVAGGGEDGTPMAVTTR
jgi:hypothetical protein